MMMTVLLPLAFYQVIRFPFYRTSWTLPPPTALPAPTLLPPDPPDEVARVGPGPWRQRAGEVDPPGLIRRAEEVFGALTKYDETGPHITARVHFFECPE